MICSCLLELQTTPLSIPIFIFICFLFLIYFLGKNSDHILEVFFKSGYLADSKHIKTLKIWAGFYAGVIAFCSSIIFFFISNDSEICKRYSNQYTFPWKIFVFLSDQIVTRDKNLSSVSMSRSDAPTPSENYYSLVVADWSPSTNNVDESTLNDTYTGSIVERSDKLETPCKNSYRTGLRFREKVPLLLLTSILAQKNNNQQVAMLAYLGDSLKRDLFDQIWYPGSDITLCKDGSSIKLCEKFNSLIDTCYRNLQRRKLNEIRTDFSFLLSTIKEAIRNIKSSNNLRDNNYISVIIVSDFWHEETFQFHDKRIIRINDAVKKELDTLSDLNCIRQLTLVQLPSTQKDPFIINRLIKAFHENNSADYECRIDMSAPPSVAQPIDAINELLAGSVTYEMSNPKINFNCYYPSGSMKSGIANLGKFSIAGVPQFGETFQFRLRGDTSLPENTQLIVTADSGGTTKRMSLNKWTSLRVPANNVISCQLAAARQDILNDSLFLDIYYSINNLKRTFTLSLMPFLSPGACRWLLFFFVTASACICNLLTSYAYYFNRHHPSKSRSFVVFGIFTSCIDLLFVCLIGYLVIKLHNNPDMLCLPVIAILIAVFFAYLEYKHLNTGDDHLPPDSYRANSSNPGPSGRQAMKLPEPKPKGYLPPSQKYLPPRDQ